MTYRPRFREGVVVVVIPTEADRYGFRAAGVLNQIRFWCGFHKTEWFEASSEDLADLTGIPPRAIRTEVGKLIDVGAIERRRNVGSHGEQKPSYRVLVSPNEKPTVSAGADSVTPVDGSVTPGGADSVTPTYVRDKEISSPHGPPKGGDLPPRLFAAGDPDGGCDGRASKKRRAEVPDVAKAGLVPLLDLYPKGKRRGNVQAAERAFWKACQTGATSAEIEQQIGVYNRARGLYAEHWGVQAPLMNLSTFINSRERGRLEFTEEYTIEDVQARWPAPSGESWERGRSKKRRTRAEILNEAS